MTAKESERMISRTLGRDRIPEIIRAEGQVPTVRMLAGDGYRTAPHARPREEVEEFVAGGSHAPSPWNVA